MKRRQFGRTMAATVGAASIGKRANLAATPPRTARRNTLMHVGGDYHSVAGGRITSRENLEYNLRHGVKHITAQMAERTEGAGWDPDELKRMRDNCDKYGVTFEAIRMDPRYITLRPGAERDRELDTI